MLANIVLVQKATRAAIPVHLVIGHIGPAPKVTAAPAPGLKAHGGIVHAPKEIALHTSPELRVTKATIPAQAETRPPAPGLKAHGGIDLVPKEIALPTNLALRVTALPINPALRVTKATIPVLKAHVSTVLVLEGTRVAAPDLKVRVNIVRVPKVIEAQVPARKVPANIVLELEATKAAIPALTATNIAAPAEMDHGADRASHKIALLGLAVVIMAQVNGLPRVLTVPVSNVSFPTLLFSIVVLAALLVIVFRLINRERRRHLLFDQVAPSEIAKPFPQSVTYPTGTCTPQIAPETAYQAVRLAYADWLAKLLLPDQEPGQSFVRMGVEKHNLRFQVLSTSFGQALALLFSVVMAGDDLLAHQRFERLLAFCLSHPAADQAALTSWQSLPDARTARRQDTDLHAEGWIALALLAAQKQWSGSDRFDLSIVINDRLAALSAVYLTRQQLDPQPYLINSPAFLKVLQQSTNNTNWQSLSDP